MIVNHVGLRVLDLDRSTRFYEALGFRPALTADIPDGPSARLLRLDEPVGLRASYLVNDGFVLELLAYAHHAGAPVERSMAETGLTHLSLGITDLAEAKALVEELGGEVLDDTDLGVACMVRDPDGQLLELLHVDARPVTP